MTTLDIQRKVNLGWTALSARRASDILISSAGLVLLAPLLALIILAVWIEGGRPVFFSQARIGQGGRPFRIYKFRKFASDCGTSGCGVTVKSDHRLTRLGAFLEKTKLDELPQLWNILRGDMSLAGPRPESQKFADCFAGGYNAVLRHKPGLFGPSQFYFRNEGTLYPAGIDPESFYRQVLFPLKADIDLGYFPHRTLAADFGWIIRGILIVFGLRLIPAELVDGTQEKFAGAAAESSSKPASVPSRGTA